MDNSQLNKKPACPKCGGNLKRVEGIMTGAGSDYVAEDEISCRNCGWRVARPAESYLGQFRDIPLDKVKGMGIKIGNTGENRRNPRRTEACCVEGCSSKYVYYSKSRMCGIHGRILSNWVNGPQTGPPPFIPHSFLKDMMELNPECITRNHIVGPYRLRTTTQGGTQHAAAHR